MTSKKRDREKGRRPAGARALTTVVLTTACAMGGGATTAEPQESPATLEVYFSPTQGPGTLRNRLAREIRDSRRTLDIALYTGMTAETARVVAARASSGCRVRILVDTNALACDAEGNARAEDPGDGPRWHLILSEAGVPLRVMTPVATADGDRPAFHHKFAVIDSGRVLTGSWNWSAKGDGANYENFVVIRDAPFARRFEVEFEQLWAQAGTEAASGVPSGAEKRSVSPKSNKRGRSSREALIPSPGIWQPASGPGG